MFRSGLIALLLPSLWLVLGSEAMAHDRDRVRVFVDVGSYGDVSYGLSYVGGGWDHGRWDGWHRYDRRWDHRHYDRHSYWRHGRYYSAPRGYYYYPKRHYYRDGYPRGYYGDRHWHDRWHDGRRDGRRWHRH
jgi:hypothetical protein